ERGRDPWEEVVAEAGLKAVADRVPRMGIFSAKRPAGVVVTATEPGGSADLAGVRVGDVLISVGDIAIEDQQFGAKFRSKYASSPEGTPLPIIVARGGQRLTLNGKVMFASGQMRI